MPATNPDKKPYYFVPLHKDGKSRAEPKGHDRWSNLSGKLSLRLVALSPLHVASGMTASASELRRHTDILWPPNFSEPLILDHYRSGGIRVIPATSLKGIVRSIVEAISRSCIRVTSGGKRGVYRETGARETPFRRSKACSVPRHVREGEPVRLCPACRIFGAMSFEGNVRFTDAPQREGRGHIALRPAPQQPNKNERDNTTDIRKYYRQVEDGEWHVKGRKFYRHFGQPQNQHIRYEPVEVCDKGSVFNFDITFNSLPPAEFGLLLTALGQGDGVKIFKLGASKPFGYGAVEIAECRGEIWDEVGMRARCVEWDERTVASLDWASACERALEQARSLILAEQLETLKRNFNEAAVTGAFNGADIARWREGKDDYAE